MKLIGMRKIQILKQLLL